MTLKNWKVLLNGFLQGLREKGRRLEKERNSIIAAKLKFDTAEPEAEGLYREIENKARIAKIGDVKKSIRGYRKEKVL